MRAIVPCGGESVFLGLEEQRDCRFHFSLFFLFRNSNIKIMFQILNCNSVERGCTESQGNLLSKWGRNLWLFPSADIVFPITSEEF